jgi:hypothetical protein
MANQEQMKILSQGVEIWNKWRTEHSELDIDLEGADLSGRDIARVNLIKANLNKAIFTESILRKADLSEATLNDASFFGTDLRGASLGKAVLFKAGLSGATLHNANLADANLSMANLTEADLSYANLQGARLAYTTLVRTNLRHANLSGCTVYGTSVWNVNLEGTLQSNLIITDINEPRITVDNLEVAQFIYLLLNNKTIRDVINSVTSKAVLILGRFTLERIAILNAIRDDLRRRDYLPILFDFEKPSSRNMTETVSTLAHLARFVVADLTDAKSIPQELQRIVPELPSLPVQPLILSSQYEYSMFKDLLDYPWVLAPYRYDNQESLLASLEEKVIAPAISKANEIVERRKVLELRFVNDSAT